MQNFGEKFHSHSDYVPDCPQKIVLKRFKGFIHESLKLLTTNQIVLMSQYQNDICSCNILLNNFIRILIVYTDCPPNMCMMHCENGFKKDENGCDICECNGKSLTKGMYIFKHY